MATVTGLTADKNVGNRNRIGCRWRNYRRTFDSY